MNEQQQKNEILTFWLPIGFLIGLIVSLIICNCIIPANAAEIQDLTYDTPFIIASDTDNYVYGYRVGAGSQTWLREEFGLIYANKNDNNNISAFYDTITYYVTATGSWANASTVKRGGFDANGFGIVYGNLLTPQNGFMFDSSTEIFHLSKNQWVAEFSCPRQTDYGMTEGYYQIYFYDVHQDFMTSDNVNAGRHPVICMCIPIEHYNEFVLNTDTFEYPYQDYKVFYYDYSLNGGMWTGILPLPFHFDDTYTLAYADRSVKLRANGGRVHIESMKFSSNSGSTPTPTPPEESSTGDYHFIFTAPNSSYAMLLKLSVTDFSTPVTLPSSSALTQVQTDYNTLDNVARYAAFFTGQASSHYYLYGSNYVTSSTAAFLYFSSETAPTIRWAIVPLTAIDSDWEVLDSAYLSSSQGGPVESNHSGSINWPSPGPGYAGWTYHGLIKHYTYHPNIYCFAFGLQEAASNSLYSIYRTDLISSKLHASDVILSDSMSAIASTDDLNALTQYDRYYKYLTLAMDLTEYEMPAVTPTPSPTPTPEPTSTPSPTPTPMGSIIVIWPTGTPTPTPFLNLPITTPSGSDLTQDSTHSVLDYGGEYLRNWTSNGLLAAAFSFVPSELQFLIWFLVFILIILAVIKFILHFVG